MRHIRFKFNKNMLLFAFVFTLLLTGLCTRKNKRIAIGNAVLVRDGQESFSEFTDIISGAAVEKYRYHDRMMDLYSGIMMATGKDTVVKADGTTIVRMANGYLTTPEGKISDDLLHEYANKVVDLCQVAKDNGAEFLFIEAPEKGYWGGFPVGVDNFKRTNDDRFAQMLREKDIPLLNLIDKMHENGLTEEEMFFVTDHHWKPEAGFWTFGKICEELNLLYGFSYDPYFTDIGNYDIKNYENWFLGSQGKKVGVWFTKYGADDISLITPKFYTNLIEEQPIKEEMREGRFEDSVLFMSEIEEKDYYNKNPYAVYSGGDFRLQIMRNRMNPDGKKILIVRDSFACAVAPFLALVSSELHITDTRNYAYVGDKLNVYDYIKEIKPDYVLVLYTGISEDTAGRFDFD